MLLNHILKYGRTPCREIYAERQVNSVCCAQPNELVQWVCFQAGLNTSPLQQRSEHLFSFKKLCGNFEGRAAVRLVIGVDLAHRLSDFVERLKRKQPAPAAIVVLGEARLLCDYRPSTREIACASVTEPPCTEPHILIFCHSKFAF